MGIGMKYKYAHKEIIPNHTLIFKDNTRLDVRKIGQNSAYFFYVSQGRGHVPVAAATRVAASFCLVVPCSLRRRELLRPLPASFYQDCRQYLRALAPLGQSSRQQQRDLCALAVYEPHNEW